ncbi:MAG: DUF4054 domain-containing protein [Nitratireductor sp.]|nr:DUF4054 domain-containing protein [Nitratireductor sp.]
MPDHTVPNADTFKTRFPEFGLVADATVNAVLVEAGRTVIQGDGSSAAQTWIENDIGDACLWLAAHLLTLQGEPGRSQAAAIMETDNAASLSGGGIKSHKVGDTQIEFFQDGSILGSGGGSTDSAPAPTSVDLSAYGKRYQELLRRSFPPVMCV